MKRFWTILFIIGFIGCDYTKVTVKQWEPHEFTFETVESYNYFDFPIQMKFYHENGRDSLSLDAYWIGENNWQVRFASTKTGNWNWQIQSIDPDLNGKSGKIQCVAPSLEDINTNPNYRGKVKIIPQNRFFTYADGTPVLLLAEQFWDFNLSSWITVDESQQNNVLRYLSDRKTKGFNVVQMRFMRTSKENEGGTPFPKYDKSKSGSLLDSMNVNYFQFLDERFEYCFNNGFIVAGHPEWIGSALKINLEEAKKLERFFLARYGAYNLIYSISGEFDKNFHQEYRNKTGIYGIWNDSESDSLNMLKDPDPWRELGAHISSYNTYKTPLSIHPGWHNPVLSSSGDFLHNQEWLDHTWIQTYKDVYAVPREVRDDYLRIPAKPIFFSEGIREGDQTEDINMGNYGVRWESWQAYLNGAAGYTYRHYGIYLDSWYQKGLAKAWPENLDAPGSFDVGIAKEFLSNLNWWELEPMNENITINDAGLSMPDSSTISELSKFVSVAAIPGNLYIVYVPRGNADNEIKIVNVKPGSYNIDFFNPRTGKTLNNKSEISITNGEWLLPDRSDNNDWVLLLHSK